MRCCILPLFRPWACETGQSLWARRSVFKLTSSSRNCPTVFERLSFSTEYISTFCCRLASHCFLRCLHLRAATLKKISESHSGDRNAYLFLSRKFFRFSSSVIFLPFALYSSLDISSSSSDGGSMLIDMPLLALAFLLAGALAG